MATNNSHGAKLEILVMYKECLHNHASKTLGYVLDGCGQFVANGPNGTPQAMVCAACNCHRNFHRRVDVELPASNGIPESNALLRQSEMVIPPASFSHQQPQQRRIYQPNSTMHARTTEPTDATGRHQINRPEGLQLGTSLVPSSQRPSRAQSEDTYQPQSFTRLLSRVSQVPIYRSLERQVTEAECRMRRKKMTEEQNQALRTIAERNNWKLFRNYAKEEVNQICSSIGITRNVMKRWIYRQRRKRAAAVTAAEGAEAAATAGGSGGSEGGKGSRGRNRNESRGSRINEKKSGLYI